MRSGENPKKQPENAKNRLKIVSNPLKIARKRHFLSKHGIFELKNMRRPQAGREILARHVNILPTFRRESANSQHQHFGRVNSTLSLFLTKGPVFALDFFSDSSAMEELLGARVLSAATQPLRDFAAELRREFLMAGVDAIGCGCEYFPCRGAWYSLVCRLSSGPA